MGNGRREPHVHPPYPNPTLKTNPNPKSNTNANHHLELDPDPDVGPAPSPLPKGAYSSVGTNIRYQSEFKLQVYGVFCRRLRLAEEGLPFSLADITKLFKTLFMATNDGARCSKAGLNLARPAGIATLLIVLIPLGCAITALVRTRGTP